MTHNLEKRQKVHSLGLWVTLEAYGFQGSGCGARVWAQGAGVLLCFALVFGLRVSLGLKAYLALSSDPPFGS